jgi:hypothetical protein
MSIDNCRAQTQLALSEFAGSNRRVRIRTVVSQGLRAALPLLVAYWTTATFHATETGVMLLLVGLQSRTLTLFSAATRADQTRFPFPRSAFGDAVAIPVIRACDPTPDPIPIPCSVQEFGEIAGNARVADVLRVLVIVP